MFLLAVTALQALINAYGISATARLTDFSGYLIFGTSLLIALVCLTHTRHFDFSRLWRFANYSGARGGDVWPHASGGWVFMLGLLLPIYTITGYDASAHTSEETRNARMAVPRALLSSILWSGAFGYFFLVAVPADAAGSGRGRQAGLERVFLGTGGSACHCACAICCTA